MVGIKDTLIVFPSEFSDKDFLFFTEKGYPIKYASIENKWSCYFFTTASTRVRKNGHKRCIHLIQQ